MKKQEIIKVIKKNKKPTSVFVVRNHHDIEKCRMVVENGSIWEMRAHSSHVLTNFNDSNVDGYFLTKRELNKSKVCIKEVLK